jgi:hypothetical protein
MGPLLMAALDLRPVGRQCVLKIGEIDDHAVLRKVIGENRCHAEEQRKPGLDAGRHLSRRHSAINGALLRIAFEAFPPAPAKLRDGFRGGRNFTCRQERHGSEPVRGALVPRIEAAYGLDQVVEQVQAIGLRCAGRKQIDHRTAHRELAGAQYLSDLHVAGIGESLSESRQVDPLARAQRKRMRLDEAAWRKPVEERRQCCDDDALPQVRQCRERPQPFGNDVRVGRESIVRQGFAIGKRQDRLAAGQEEPEFRKKLVCFAAAARNDDERCAGRGCGCREVVGGTAAIELAPAHGLGGCRHGGPWNRIACHAPS